MAPALQGGHIQRNNGICSTISDGLREVRCPHLGADTHCTCKGIFRNACPAVTDETAMKIINEIIPDLALQLGHLSPDEHSLAGCDHLADTETLNASKQHYHTKSTDFGFAVNLRQTEVKSDNRYRADKLDAEHRQLGGATTFNSILNGYGKDGEVLGLVVGYSSEASSDVYRVADPTSLEASRVHQNVGVNCKGDANPAHLPRLGILLCTWIRAGHLGSRAEQPGPGTRLSQLGERVGR
jgi:hypothetical protein